MTAFMARARRSGGCPVFETPALRQSSEILSQARADFSRVVFDGEGARAGPAGVECFHRLVEHDFVATSHREFGKRRRRWRAWQDGDRHRCRQREGALPCAAVPAQVGDHEGEAGSRVIGSGNRRQGCGADTGHSTADAAVGQAPASHLSRSSAG